MQVIIIGCGRVGVALARFLVESGEDVVVIDKDRSKLDQISQLDCLTIDGAVIDRDTMEQAGMANADVVCCVSDQENLNLMAGQIAKEFFGVPLVIMRVYNTSTISVFEEPGFRLLSSTELTLQQILNYFDQPVAPQALDIEGNELSFYRRPYEEDWEGRDLNDIEEELGSHVLGVLRQGKLYTLRSKLVCKAGDDLLLAESAADREED